MIGNLSTNIQQTSNKISAWNFYTKKGLWTLFLMCALPLHIWTIILTINDISWLSERTDTWDAIGVMSYGLIFTLVESLIIFLSVMILGFLISSTWDENTRISILSTLIVILSLWGMLNHSYFLWELYMPDKIIGFLAGTKHPLRMLYGFTLIPIGISFVAPTYLILKSKKILEFILAAVDRLSLLMMVYLLLDLAGMVIVIIRNLRGAF